MFQSFTKYDIQLSFDLFNSNFFLYLQVFSIVTTHMLMTLCKIVQILYCKSLLNQEIHHIGATIGLLIFGCVLTLLNDCLSSSTLSFS